MIPNIPRSQKNQDSWFVSHCPFRAARSGISEHTNCYTTAWKIWEMTPAIMVGVAQYIDPYVYIYIYTYIHT